VELAKVAEEIGFAGVLSGPLVDPLTGLENFTSKPLRLEIQLTFKVETCH
jgi:hypothetical protein